MSLRTKILIILLTVITLYAGLDYGIQRLIIFPSFANLEKDEAEKDMERCVYAIEREIHHLDLLCQDWACWNDTYQFIIDQNQNYSNANLVPETIIGNKLNLIYILNSSGKVIWGEIYDLETKEKITIKEFSKDIFSTTHPLLKHKALESSIKGIVLTEKGPILIASRPIITSEHKGPIRGTLMMGRFLNDTVLKTLTEQTRVTFRFWSIEKNSIPAKDKTALSQIKTSSPFFISKYSDQLLYIYTTFSDVQNVPILLLRVDIPRAITARGEIALRFALFSIIVVGLSILFVLIFLLQKIVIGPIGKLTAHTITIGKTDDLSIHLSSKRPELISGDEIGQLAQEFDRVVEKLSSAQKKLSEASYHTGMAEMASGVLHNIRNAMSPITVYIDDLLQKLQSIPVEQIKIAREEFVYKNPPEERRRDLIQFLELADKKLSVLLIEINNKLVEMGTRTNQIEKILGEQDKISHFNKRLEKIKIGELINDSIASLSSTQRDKILFKIDPCIQNMDSISAHRISLKQVFNNIIINAIESIRRSGKSYGEVNISANIETRNNKEMIHIKITDNGEGIDVVNLEHIFERGFTTKQEGSSGMGLNWCAITVSATNGRIYTESAGKGQGATFHILFPKNN